MSGECQLCHEHCLDCKCGKEELGLRRTGYFVKFNACFVTVMSPEKMEKQLRRLNEYSHKSSCLGINATTCKMQMRYMPKGIEKIRRKVWG